MSDTTPDKEFWEIADGFIDLANQRCDTVSSGKISSALLYSAARFNAFVVLSATKTKEEFSGRKEETVTYFVGQFESMLRENLDDHEAHFEKHISQTGEL